MGFGGAETLAHDLAVAVRAKGPRTNIICLDSITREVTSLAGRGIPVELVKRGTGSFDPGTYIRLVRRLKILGTTLIHAHDMSSLDYAVPAGFWLRAPVIMTEHSRHYIEERLRRRLEKRALCLGISVLVEVSGELAKASRQDGVSPEKITVIENGVDVERFSLARRDRLRAELGVGADSVLAGMVGRLEEIKGPQILLESFIRMAARYPAAQAHLVFAGDGSLRATLEARAKALGLENRVHFLGSRADVPEIMAGLDILVLPSLSEGLPFALLEGMAAGRAVVASSVGAVPDVLGNGCALGLGKKEGPAAPGNRTKEALSAINIWDRGVLVEPANPAMLADVLAALARDPKGRACLGLAAKAHVARHYGKQTMVERYVAVYARALSGRRAS